MEEAIALKITFFSQKGDSSCLKNIGSVTRFREAFRIVSVNSQKIAVRFGEVSRQLNSTPLQEVYQIYIISSSGGIA